MRSLLSQRFALKIVHPVSTVETYGLSNLKGGLRARDPEGIFRGAYFGVGVALNVLVLEDHGRCTLSSAALPGASGGGELLVAPSSFSRPRKTAQKLGRVLEVDG